MLIMVLMLVGIVRGEDCVVDAPYDQWCTIDGDPVSMESSDQYRIEVVEDFLGDILNVTTVDNRTMVLFQPNIIGVGTISVYRGNDSNQTSVLTVIWKGNIWQKIFQYVTIGCVMSMMFCIGCELDLRIIWNYVRRPFLPLIGLGCQYVIMPGVAMSIYLLTSLTPELGLGLFTLASSPGGFGSNMWCIVLDGDLNLSSAMTFFSTVVSPVMMLLWLSVFQFMNFITTIRIPYAMISLQLLDVIVPLVLGTVFSKYCPRAKSHCIKCGRIIIIVFMIHIVTFGTYVNLHIYRLLWIYPRGIFVGALLSWIAFGLSYTFCAMIVKLSQKLSVTVALETSIQNIGIALIILRYSMPQPQGDIASMVPILSGYTVFIPLWTYWMMQLTIKKCKPNKPDIFEPSRNWQHQYNNPSFEA